LHCVGYGYQKRGIPFWLLNALRKWRHAVPRSRLVTVFHELYATSPYPWQSSFWLSSAQRYVAREIARLSDAVLTPVESYAEELVAWNPRLRGHCKTVPVFSNVGEPACVASPLLRRPVIVVFAGPGAAQPLYSRYESLLARSIEFLGIERIVDIGSRTVAPPARIAGTPIIAHGLLPASDVSAVLRECRYGMMCYPLRKADKSGIFAAYAAHGVISIFAGAGRYTAEFSGHGTRILVAEQIHRALSEEELVSLAAAATDRYRTHSIEIHAGLIADLIGERTIPALAE
jgi:hypothetical protein